MARLFRRKPEPPSPDDSGAGARLFEFCVGHARRWLDQKDPDDLRQAVEFGEQSVAVTPAGDKLRADRLLGLFVLRRDQAELTGSAAEGDRAIEIGEQVVAATAGQADQARYASDVASACLTRYDRDQNPDDLERAIELHEHVVATTPHTDPSRRRRQADLWNAYGRRYNRTGSAADLEKSIELALEIVAETPLTAPDGPRWHGDLGTAYRARYQHTGLLADLELGLDLGERAVAAVGEDDPLQADLRIRLGDGYAVLFVLDRRAESLERAIELVELALGAKYRGDPAWASAASYLAQLHGKRYGLTKAEEDAERAIELGEQALAETSADDPELAERLSRVGLVHLDRYAHTQAPADADRAIEFTERAVRATPGDDPRMAPRLANLGLAGRGRFETDGRPIEPGRLRELVRRTAEANTGFPIEQVRARYEVGSLAEAMNEHELAAPLLDGAVHLLSSTVPWEGGWQDQEGRLGRYPHLVSASVAAHCALGDPAGAVEIAEFGRGLILAGHQDFRTDLTGLEAADPELARRFRDLRAGLGSGESPIMAATRTATRKRLWSDYRGLLGEIRERPGFSRFLLAPRLPELRSAASGGAVVLVNVGQWRGDAVIITATADPVLVPLTGLIDHDLRVKTWELLDATRDRSPLTGRLKKRRVLPEVLDWLRDTIVGPVLEALPGANPASPPRLWWMPTGELGLFPLHAAALDVAVSSYTPTLRTLAHARSRPRAAVRRQLTVTVSHTPGWDELPGTADEAASLRANRPGTIVLADERATAKAVLAALPGATWTHFACHAVANLAAPSHGGLRLHDRILPLPAIGELDLPQAELAYLSACSTAGRGTRHADESLHLASLFQLAGFRHVVASLWPLEDSTAAATARAFYGRLPSAPDADHAALALHQVTRELRAERPDRPDLWASLIHNGP